VFEDIFLVSALKGEGVADVASWVAARMPEGPWLYPEDQAADIPSRLLAAEVTREKIYLRLHDELPYASAVETEKWEERRDGSVKIDQVIYVQRDGQKRLCWARVAPPSRLSAVGAGRAGKAVRPPRASVFVREGARGLGRE
jgi:GTPase Era involved in 16S rRNA processing